MSQRPLSASPKPGDEPSSKPGDEPSSKSGDEPSSKSGNEPAPKSGDAFPLSQLVCALGLLIGDGLSLGLALWALLANDLTAYIARNELDRTERSQLLAEMAGGALVFALAAGAVLVRAWRRGSLRTGVDLVHRVAWRSAPLILVGLLPFLLRWRLWFDRDLTFLALAALLTLSLQSLVRVAITTPPIFEVSPLRRLEQRLMRPAARAWLARVTPALPWLVVIAGIVGYATFFGYHTVVGHQNLQTSTMDLGLENNLVWNALHGSRPLFKSSPLGRNVSHFGYHATVISYLFALPYAFYPKPEALLVFQAVLMGAAALPLFLFARRHTGNGVAAVLAVVYLCYPPVHGAALYDFHYLSLAPAFLWTTTYALDARKTKLTIASVILTLMVREDVAAGLAIVGALFLVTNLRPRAGLLVAGIGLSYFVIMKLVVMPMVRGEPSFVFMFSGLLPPGESGFSGVLKTVFGNPSFTAERVLERDKLVYVLHIFTPLAFLPLRRPLGLLCCAPGFFFTLLSTGYAPLIQPSFQYTANWTSYVFLACVFHLVWVARSEPLFAPEVRPRRAAWIIAIVAGTLLTTTRFGAFVQQERVVGGFSPYHFGTTAKDEERRRQLYSLIDLVPPMAKITSSEMIVAQVSSRPDAYTLRFGLYDAEYLLFEMPPRPDEIANLRTALSSNYGIIAVLGPFILAKAGASTQGNAGILRRLDR